MSYWKPGPALWPLLAVFGAAGAACSWSVLRQLKSNPDVHLTKAHRMNGAGEDPTTLKRAQEYAHSIFRRAHAMRKGPGDDRADTRIFTI